jgi:radical SAM superfamily enzyme YgiQ (UPF0313 family)
MKTLEIMSQNVPVLPLVYLGSYLDNHGKSVFISEAETLSEMKKEIISFSPHIVGVTATTCQIIQAFEVARMVKTIDPHIIVVGGGPHMTFRYAEPLISGDFDIVVRGAGESPLRALTEGHPLKTIQGIAFRDNDSICVLPSQPLSLREYNDFPPPAYYLLRDLRKYKKNVLLNSSRGCPFHCSMCASSLLWGNRWIFQHPETMISHLEAVLSQFHGISPLMVRYYDDTFTVHKKRILKFLTLMKKKEIHISFKCESRVDTFDDELACALRESGCTEVFFGIESGNQKFLNGIDKRITLRQIVKAVETAHRRGLKVCGSLMIGYPGETMGDVRETIAFSKKLQLDRMQLSILTPFPGTPLFTEAQEQGWITTHDWNVYDGTYPVMHLKEYLENHLISLLKKGYVSFYLNPCYIYRQIKSGYLIQGGYGKEILSVLIKYLSTI